MTSTIIPKSLNQSAGIIYSALNSGLHILLIFSVVKVNFEEQLSALKTIAKDNGYNLSIIDQLI